MSKISDEELQALREFASLIGRDSKIKKLQVEALEKQIISSEDEVFRRKRQEKRFDTSNKLQIYQTLIFAVISIELLLIILDI